MTIWLFIPFKNDTDLTRMADEWINATQGDGRERVIVRVSAPATNSLKGVQTGDRVLIMAHGNCGCSNVANLETDATEEISEYKLADIVVQAKLPLLTEAAITLYACQAAKAGGGYQNDTFASRFANCMRGAGYCTQMYGFTESVTIPRVNGKRAVNDANDDIGRALDHRILL